MAFYSFVFFFYSSSCVIIAVSKEWLNLVLSIRMVWSFHTSIAPKGDMLKQAMAGLGRRPLAPKLN